MIGFVFSQKRRKLVRSKNFLFWPTKSNLPKIGGENERENVRISFQKNQSPHSCFFFLFFFLLFSFGFCLFHFLLLFSFLFSSSFFYATLYSFCLFHFGQNCPLGNNLSSSFLFIYFIYIYMFWVFFILLFSLICFGFLHFFKK